MTNFTKKNHDHTIRRPSSDRDAISAVKLSEGLTADIDAWAEKSKGMMPEFLIADMRIMYQFFQDNGMIAAVEDLEKTLKLLGHKPRTFDDFVREIAVEWKSKVMKAA